MATLNLKHNYERLMQKGQEQLGLGQYQKSELAFQEAARIAPNMGEPHNYLGYLSTLQSRWEQARIEYSLAAKLQPDDPQTFFSLYEAYHRLGQDDVYLQRLENDQTANKAGAQQIALALTAVQQQDFVQALGHYQQAEKLFPPSTFLMRKIGDLLLRLHKPQEARDILEQADRMVRAPETLRLLGVAEWRAGHRAAAIQALQTADAQNPNDLRTLYDLAKVEMQMGHWRSAWHHFRQIIKLEQKAQQKLTQKNTRSANG